MKDHNLRISIKGTQKIICFIVKFYGHRMRENQSIKNPRFYRMK